MEPGEIKNGTGDRVSKAYPISFWLCAVVVLGAVLRFILVGRKSFWLDEIASVVIARLSGQAFWSMLWHAEGNMALYYVLLRPWLHFGTGEATVRVLSALIGIVSIPVMCALSLSLFGKTTARISTLFFALNACAIAVSQEARGYGLLVLGVIASTYLFFRLIEKPSFAIACAYGLVTGLTLYSHYFGMFIPAAHAISLVALPPGKRPWKQLALAASFVVLAAIPVLWMIHIQDIGHITWVEKPSWLEFYRAGTYLAAGSGKAVGGILLALDLILLALFLRKLKLLWPSRQQGFRCWRYAMIASCLFTPVVITLTVSLVRPIFYHRFLIIALPAWVLMTAVGAEQIRSRTWRVAAIASVCILSLVSAIASYTRAQEDWRGVTGYLMAQARPEDRVLYYQPEGYFAVENYRSWLPAGWTNRPQGVSVSPANGDWEKQIAGAPRVWLVLYRAKQTDPSTLAIDAQLRNRYGVVQQSPFSGVTVLEYSGER